MQSGNAATGYCIWGVDNIVYGPVDLPTLVNWVQEERVTADTWINIQDRDKWERAAQIAELKMFFQPASAGGAKKTTLSATDGTTLALKPGALRRVRILAGLNDRQLERFVGFMELERVRQWTEIVKQGSPGDAMYLILEGEVRVRMMIAGKERILVTLAPGEFFGEIALLDAGTRSADVLANQDSLLLRITAAAVHKLIIDAPDVAAPFLMAISKTLVARIRADNKRYRESITFPSTMR
jgi:hypothetical protein